MQIGSIVGRQQGPVIRRTQSTPQASSIGSDPATNLLNQLQAQNGAVSRSSMYPQINIRQQDISPLLNSVDSYASRLPAIFEQLEAQRIRAMQQFAQFQGGHGGGGGLLWKPVSEMDGRLAVLAPSGDVAIVDAQGNVIESGRDYGASNGYGATVRFSRPGSAYNNVYLKVGGQYYSIPKGGSRYENPSPVELGLNQRQNTGGTRSLSSIYNTTGMQ